MNGHDLLRSLRVSPHALLFDYLCDVDVKFKLVVCLATKRESASVIQFCLVEISEWVVATRPMYLP